MNEKCRETLQYISGLGDGVPPNGSCRIKSEDASEVKLLDAYSRAVITVVDAVGPTVVGISVGRVANGNVPEQRGAGSGTIIAPDGYILTNNHVVQGADVWSVTLQDGTTLEATLIGMDPAADLAILRTSGSGLPYATLGDSSVLRAGQLVIAIGNPFGFQSTVSTGVLPGGRPGRPRKHAYPLKTLPPPPGSSSPQVQYDRMGYARPSLSLVEDVADLASLPCPLS